ncbi:AAA family ATPase [Actinomadura barringtoniae]|uniref:AAA family ATPase n=1 Tax=Actinomadura barringtoniae TaxID=1427535 RepID=A0A939P7S6_9ACTN|nr:LuxR C-terminal-related transcriptional regulator [Actinomadura barringtoniae]MBO2447417.1 AAA family ATPase [Actinomadura barringtoniae]
MSTTPAGTPDNATAIPTRPEWIIERPRLAARLDKGVRGPLTVVTGPPGAGKTALVATWAHAREHAGAPPPAPAWVTCDVGMEPGPFWSRVVRALTRAGVLGDDFVAVEHRPNGADDLFLADVAAALTGRPDRTVLVLDDFQAPLSPVVIHGLASLVELARPSLRLVLVGRHDPPLALHRYRLAQELTEIRRDALAFGHRETQALLAQHDVALSPASLEALHRRTEGWAAGLRMAAMSMEQHPDPEAFVAHFAGDDQAVVGYLVEQILDAQSTEERHVLLRTSLPDRITADLAAELAGAEAGRLFPVLVRQNAFVQPLGGGWYRYQQMFAEALRLVLRHEMPGEVSALHSRAARWFGDAGLLTEAVRHAVRAGDWPYACRLAVDRLAVGEVLGISGDHALANAFRGLPVAMVTAGDDPAPALMSAAEALGRGDDRACARALGRAEALLGAHTGVDGPRQAAARLTATIIHIVRSAPGDEASLRVMLADADVALAGFPDELTALRPELHALVNGTRGRMDFRAGRLSEAAVSFGAAVQAWTDSGADYERRTDLGYLGLVEALSGRFRRAADLAVKAARMPDAAGPTAGRLAAPAHLARAWACLEAYDLAATRKELDRADLAIREWCEGAGRLSESCLTGLHGLVSGRAELASGRADRAIERLRAAQRVAPPEWLSRRITVAEAEALVTRGEGQEACDVLERAGGESTAEGRLVLARAQLSEGAPATSAGTLRPLLAESTAVPPNTRVEAWLLEACLAYASGDCSRGRRSLDRALRLAEREWVLLPFAIAAGWLRPVLRRDGELRRVHRRLLTPVGLGGEPAVTMPGDDEADIVGHLSARELEVLGHLAGMLTTEEIAQEMYVSINTVKTHLKSIYRKLAVTRRGDAVRRARQLSLL